MLGNKSHTLLSEADLLSIVECTEDELLKASAVLDATSRVTLDGIFEAGIFARLIEEKKLNAATIKVQGERAFVLIYGFNSASWLVIEGAVALGRRPIKDLLEGSYALARHLRTPKIVIVTKLKGLYQYCLDHNFKSVGAMLCCEVPA